MSFHLDRVHVWACEVPDAAGGVASKLHALAEAGENLLICRHSPTAGSSWYWHFVHCPGGGP